MPEPMRATASVGSFELTQTLLKICQKLERLGLKLDLRAGAVRITTAEVRPRAPRDYFVAIAEQSETPRAERSDTTEEEGPLSTTGLDGRTRLIA